MGGAGAHRLSVRRLVRSASLSPGERIWSCGAPAAWDCGCQGLNRSHHCYSHSFAIAETRRPTVSMLFLVASYVPFAVNSYNAASLRQSTGTPLLVSFVVNLGLFWALAAVTWGLAARQYAANARVLAERAEAEVQK